MKRVSVIVPCYRAEKYLEQMLRSLIDQTLKDMEIILVDDGSPDRTGEICDKYAAADDRIVVIHKENAGVGAARNDGMRIASGEYVIFADADDRLPRHALLTLYRKAADSGADVVIGDVIQVSGDRETYARFYRRDFVSDDRRYIDELIKAVFYRAYCPDPYRGRPAFGYGRPWNKLVKKKLLDERHIRFDVSVKGIYDDIIYSAYILAFAERVAYVSKPVYEYRIVPGSITRAYRADTPEIDRAIVTAWTAFLERFNENDKFTAPFYANVLRRLDESLSRYFFHPNNPKPLSARLSELKARLASKPYAEIGTYAEKEKLQKRHLAEYELLKKRSAVGIWIFFKLLSVYKAIKKGGEPYQNGLFRRLKEKFRSCEGCA